MKKLLTKNQSLVLSVLKDSARPLSAYNILDDLRSEGIKAPPQVYRALEKLQAQGLVHRLESENAYVACCEQHCRTSHNVTAFAICEDCGCATEFDGAQVDLALAHGSSVKGFQTRRTVLELRGVCENCRPMPD